MNDVRAFLDDDDDPEDADGFGFGQALLSLVAADASASVRDVVRLLKLTDCRDGFGFTPLQRLLLQNDPACGDLEEHDAKRVRKTRALMEAGACLESPGPDGRPALLLAAAHATLAHVYVAAALEAAPLIDARDEEGRGVAHAAASNVGPGAPRALLLLPRRLLLARDCHGRSALHEAAMVGACAEANVRALVAKVPELVWQVDARGRLPWDVRCSTLGAEACALLDPFGPAREALAASPLSPGLALEILRALGLSSSSAASFSSPAGSLRSPAAA